MLTINCKAARTKSKQMMTNKDINIMIFLIASLLLPRDFLVTERQQASFGLSSSHPKLCLHHFQAHLKYGNRNQTNNHVQVIQATRLAKTGTRGDNTALTTKPAKTMSVSES